ncbi:phosphoadenosine phosphosulfate reductase family protein [Streptosporangium saharense]|uniref:3'-phosphoadenosine 5'-phosphosulfate sulfotransferase (PAPS reductase)/FAD synthetase n=1 Tax=Streptosporangium saharense TaxID=1706840 RepID=A0A7W7QH29_9ACTN|nr:phosphoadenosine phosphosulfate reductase family protein [Streptosporangium saharense]MBB4913328.1 3'-phosphoadenosine 5'-phosphosulfate sulfotransferase (PAPS reductase)/FAD synthetase [Streptosporangium saharense]
MPMLPGMPDAVAGRPAKASARPPLRTLDQAIARSHDIIAQALDRYPIVARQALVSGGNDSMVLLHLVRPYLDSSHHDAVVHVNTGIGIDDTRQHVRDTAAAWNLPLRELHPRDSYEDLVLGQVIARTGPNAGIRAVWKGFPGPAGHSVMYRRLKNEPLQRNRAAIIGTHGRSQKVLYLAGMRWDESDRRFRTAAEIDPDGGIIWCSPLAHWTNAQMREYRDRHLIPRNPVAEHLHMSGECLCGAYAKPGELDEIAFFYPRPPTPSAAWKSRSSRPGSRPASGAWPHPAATSPSPAASPDGCALPARPPWPDRPT